MLNTMFHDQLNLGFAQAGVALVLALIIVFVARHQAVHIERETSIALVRALVQIVAVGSILLFLLEGPSWTSMFVLMAMIVAASSTAAKRAKGIPGVFGVLLYGIGVGSGSVIVLMTGLGVIDAALTSVVPVGSMLIANAMTSCGLALDRFQAEIKAQTGQIEAGLALGARSSTIVAPYVQSAVYASLIPRVDNLRSLGIVWIPGIMSGMILAGADPIYAAIYQFVIMALVFAVSGLSSLLTILSVRRHVFSHAEQLTLRPGEK